MRSVAVACLTKVGFAISVFAGSYAIADTVSCPDPPGPVGSITCDTGLIAFCMAQGKSFEGFCLDPNKLVTVSYLEQPSDFDLVMDRIERILPDLGISRSGIKDVSINRESEEVTLRGTDFVVKFHF